MYEWALYVAASLFFLAIVAGLDFIAKELGWFFNKHEGED